MNTQLPKRRRLTPPAPSMHPAYHGTPASHQPSWPHPHQQQYPQVPHVSAVLVDGHSAHFGHGNGGEWPIKRQAPAQVELPPFYFRYQNSASTRTTSPASTYPSSHASPPSQPHGQPPFNGSGYNLPSVPSPGGHQHVPAHAYPHNGSTGEYVHSTHALAPNLAHTQAPAIVGRHRGPGVKAERHQPERVQDLVASSSPAASRTSSTPTVPDASGRRRSSTTTKMATAVAKKPNGAAASAATRKRAADDMLDLDDSEGGVGDGSDDDAVDTPTNDRDEVRKEKNRVKQRRLRLRRANRMTELEAECEAAQRRVDDLERQLQVALASSAAASGTSQQQPATHVEGESRDEEWRSWVADLEAEMIQSSGANGSAKIRMIRKRAPAFRLQALPLPAKAPEEIAAASQSSGQLSSSTALRRPSLDGDHSDSSSSHASSLVSRLLARSEYQELEHTSPSSAMTISPVSLNNRRLSSFSRSTSPTSEEPNAMVGLANAVHGVSGGQTTWSEDLQQTDSELYQRLLDLGCIQLPLDYAPILRDPLPFPPPTMSLPHNILALVAQTPDLVSVDAVQALNAAQAPNELELLARLQLADVEHLTDKTTLRLARQVIAARVSPDVYAPDVLANTSAAAELDRSILASEGLREHLSETWSMKTPDGPIDIADLRPTWRADFSPVEIYILSRALMYACEPAGSKAFYDGKHKAEIAAFPSQTQLIEAWEAYEARDKRVELLPGVILRLRVIMNDDLHGKGDLDLNALLTDMLHQGIIYGNAWSHYSWELGESFWTRWQPVFPAGRKFCNHLRTWRRQSGHLGVTPFQIIMGTESEGGRARHGVHLPPPGWQKLMKHHFENPH